MSPPLRLIPPPPALAGRMEREPLRLPRLARFDALRDPVTQPSSALLLAPRTLLSFEGIGQDFAGSTATPFAVAGSPSDAQGDMGLSHYVQIVNSSFAVFTRQGEAVYGPVPTRTLFAGFGGPCEKNDDGDGIVLYDPMADRWLVSQLAIGPQGAGNGLPYLECVAISRTSDPTGAYARYAFAYGLLNDYPKLGVWPDAYYATYNMFPSPAGGKFQGVQLCAFDRARMLAGEAAEQQCVLLSPAEAAGVTPVDVDGALPPPEGAPGLALGIGAKGLLLYRFHVDWTDARNSWLDLREMPIAPYRDACERAPMGACIPQRGNTASQLDALGDRMMFRAAYRNFGTHEAIVGNHTAAGPVGTGVRWYEVRDPSGEPVLHQQGTYAPDIRYRWLGSAALDRAGNIGLGFSISAADATPGIAFTGRTPADPPGVMGQGETVPYTGRGSQVGTQRWGDYSSLSVDPADECTFWHTSQYVPTDGYRNWHTRVLSFSLPGCDVAPPFAAWGPPQTTYVGRGRSASIALSTGALHASSRGAPLSLAVTSRPAGVAAALAANALRVGETVQVTVTAAEDAPLGAAPIAVAADDGARRREAALDVAVVESDFRLTPAEPQASIKSGIATEVRIDTAPLFGPAEALAFSASRLPRRVSASFDPPTVVAGGSTTLRLLGGPFLTASLSDIRITAAAASATHHVPLRVRTFDAPGVSITWPSRTEYVSGLSEVFTAAVVDEATMLASVELLVDGEKRARSFSSNPRSSLKWDTRDVSDGPHAITVVATDGLGARGDSAPVLVWVDNASACGCSSRAGGWEALAFIGLLAALKSAARRPRTR